MPPAPGTEPRAWELRGNPSSALADLEMAVALQKALEPSLGGWIDRLRRRLRR